MKDARELRRTLHRIDGRGYKSYKEIRGRWHLAALFDAGAEGPNVPELMVDYVQGDPFAAPSRVRLILPAVFTELPPPLLDPPSRRLGVACRLAREAAAVSETLRNSRGSGKSGTIQVDAPGQQVWAQTAVQIFDDGAVEARLRVGLPARGRRVLGSEAEALLLEDLPELARRAFTGAAYSGDDLIRHAETQEDAEALRGQLEEHGLVAFVAEGARLPRRSGIDDRPLEGEGVVPFTAPDRLRLTLDTPNAGPVEGMGIPEGVTLIVGGGYHGKSTLLRALERGVWDHRPCDGRERVVTRFDAVKVRAEDGRSVRGVDISPFIGTLPGAGAVDTTAFSTPNASGSTSQAATIVEAMEAGSRLLLVDEDTAATNFMIRDRRMQELVPSDREPITPFVDRVRQLYDRQGVSSVLVIGGSGDYLDVADTVIGMNAFRPADLTEEAARVAEALPTGRRVERSAPSEPRPRIPARGSIDPSGRRRPVYLKVRARDRITFGEEELDLGAVEQILDRGQTRSLSRALVWIGTELADGERTLPEILDQIDRAIEDEGLDVLERGAWGDLAAIRRYEVAAALNRLRSLRARPVDR